VTFTNLPESENPEDLIHPALWPWPSSWFDAWSEETPAGGLASRPSPSALVV